MPPRVRLWLRGAAALHAAAFVVWIGYEDQSLGYVTALGAGLGAILAANALAGRNRAGWRALGLAGLAAGTWVAPLTTVFMMIKVSLHSHEAPDFSLPQVLSVLYRTPIWAMAGLSGGIGLWAIASALSRQHDGE